MKIILSAFLLCFLVGNLYAQGSIKGMIVDKDSQFPLPGVSVFLLDSTVQVNTVTTDDLGEFSLEGVPLGRHSLLVKHPKYQVLPISNVLVVAGKATDLFLELEELIRIQDKRYDSNVVQLEEIRVYGKNTNKSEADLATVSNTSFTVEEAIRYSGSLQDVSRMAQNIAGVSGANDSRNDIVIRGNSPSGLLWRLEGIDIPSPNHFSSLGTTGGAVSMLNINNLRNSDFFTGAFPSLYSNAVAGVFDLKLRKGNNKEYEFLGQIGFNGFELGAEGPFKKGKHATFNVNYRHSTLAVFNALGVNLGTGSAVPQYKDINFKLHFPTRKHGTFQVFGIGGISYIEFLDQGEDNLFNEGGNSTRYGSNTGVLGVSHRYFFNKDTYLRSVVAFSGTGNKTSVDSTQNFGEGIVYGADNVQTKVSAHISLNSKVNSKNKIVAGVLMDSYGVSLKDSLLQEDNTYLTYRDHSGSLFLLRGYGLWKHKFTEKMVLNTGVSTQLLTSNQSFAVEPRVGVSYSPNSKNTLAIGTGMHSQIQSLEVYFSTNEGQVSQTPNTELDFSRSVHFVGSYTRNFKKKVKLKSEVYYQYLYNIPVNRFPSSFSILNAGADFSIIQEVDLVNEGKGYNYGLEFTLEKSLEKGFYGLTTLSLFESKYQAQDKVWRNTVYNGNYVWNALAGKEININKKSVLSFDFRATYSGNKRFTPILLEESIAENEEVRDQEKVFEGQYDPFMRLDFKIGFRLNAKKVSQLWAVDLQNITNQKNIFSQGYNKTTQKLGTVYQRGFFPSVIYQVLF